MANIERRYVLAAIAGLVSEGFVRTALAAPKSSKAAHAATAFAAAASQTVSLDADKISVFLADVSPWGGKVVSARKTIGPSEKEGFAPKAAITLVTDNGNRWILTTEITQDAMLAYVRVQDAKTDVLRAVITESDTSWSAFNYTAPGAPPLSDDITYRLAKAASDILRYGDVPFSQLVPLKKNDGALSALPPAEAPAPAGNAMFRKIGLTEPKS